MGDFFSDRELGAKAQTNEQLGTAVFNGVISLYSEFKMSMAKRFPETCPDNGRVVAFNDAAFTNLMTAVIPDFTLTDYGFIEPLETDADFNQYALLDFIEFCASSICDYRNDGYHDFFSHYHLRFVDTKDEALKFRDSINQIFERNGIAFTLSSALKIERVLPAGLKDIIVSYTQRGSDSELNKLIDQAIKGIIKPKPDDRQTALEKLWDAFERIKTYHMNADKKTSVSILLTTASEGSQPIHDLLKNEMLLLTTFGNDFRIRHHETTKIKIDSPEHIDYFFYRAMSILSLLVKYI